MKHLKNLLAAAMHIIPAALYAQSGDFQIKGTVPAGSKFVKVFTYNYASKNRVDSAMIENGAFAFSGHVDEPTVYLVFPSESNGTFHEAASKVSPQILYAEPGVINVSFPDSASHMVFSGGKANAELKTYQQLTAAVLAKEVEVMSAIRRAPKEELAALNKKRFELYHEQDRIGMQFATEHKDSYVAIEKLTRAARDNASFAQLTEIEKIFNSMTDAVKHSHAGKDLNDVLAQTKGSTIGGTITDFTNVDSLGKPVALHDLRGKYVLVDFWASWCGPCRAENPNVVKAYNKYKADKFTVLGVSLDKTSNRAKWLEAIAKDKLPYLQVNDPEGKTAHAFLINAIPQNFLIDPQGKIIGTNLRGEALQNKLAELFDNKK